MNRRDKKIYELGKMMASDPKGQMKYALIVITLFFVVAFSVGALVSVCTGNGYDFWNAVVAFLSPVSIRDNAPWGVAFLKLLAFIFGLIVFSGISIATITTLVRTVGERYTDGKTRYKLNDHILFLGYDEMEVGTLRKELADNAEADIVVAVPTDVAATRNIIYQHLTNEQAQRVIVIQASRVKVDDLKNAAQVQTAKRIYVVGQADEETHDAVNLKCVSLIAGLCASRGIAPQCMYYMRNQATFSMMQRQGIRATDLQGNILAAGLTYDESAVERFVMGRCEPFNFHEIAARRLLFHMNGGAESLRIDWFSDEKNLRTNPDLQLRFVIIGMSEMGTALARAVLMAVHYPNKKLKVVFVDENAHEEMHYFMGKYKSFFDNCRYSYRDFSGCGPIDEVHLPENGDFLDVEFEFMQCDVAHPELQKLMQGWAEDNNQLLSVAVCTNDTPKNMAFAMYLHRSVLANAHVWVFQRRDDSMNPFLRHDLYKNVKTFSLADIGVATPDAPEYIWAKAVDEAYTHHFGGQKKWKEKSVVDRWSSLYNALSIIIKLRVVGYDITIADDGCLSIQDFNGRKSQISLSDEQVRMLSVVEHNRWNSEKLMMGFSPSTEEQHRDLVANKITADSLKGGFIHDDIRAFEGLALEEQEKDMVLTCAILEAINNYSPHTS